MPHENAFYSLTSLLKPSLDSQSCHCLYQLSNPSPFSSQTKQKVHKMKQELKLRLYFCSLGWSTSIKCLHILLMPQQDTIDFKGLFLNKASSRGLRSDSSIGSITIHTDVKWQLHLLSVSNAPFPHLYPRKSLGYYNDSLFQQKKIKSLVNIYEVIP